ncbi:MAG TPA: XdhC/CoxI family protein [Candidatus Limnocylindria bacterium]|jgi:xanthine dehydrogenase accessory factor|nr:XdhC/CoxI family protein [Candidatus Limnocylindria bacterium]
MKEVAAELEQWLRTGDPVAIATVVRITGSAPRPLGATLIARAGEKIAGSVSNGCVESAVYEEAMAVLKDGRARVVKYGISDEFAFTVGLSCGGAIDVLIEPVGALHRTALEAVRAEQAALLVRVLAPADRAGTVAVLHEDRAEGWSRELDELKVSALAALGEGRPRTVDARLFEADASVFLEALSSPALLAIVGATHVAQALVPLAKTVGYRVVVADPRDALANRERFPLADDLLLLWPDKALAEVRLNPSSAVVVLAHDEKFDHPALVAALRSAAGYVGAIGSRTTNEKRFTWLREQGFGARDLARIHAPIGLDIGAATAEEIALSILAELVAVRHRRSGRSLSEESITAAR